MVVKSHGRGPSEGGVGQLGALPPSRGACVTGLHTRDTWAGLCTLEDPVGTEEAGPASAESTRKSLQIPHAGVGDQAAALSSLLSFTASFVQIHYPLPGKGPRCGLSGSYPCFPFPVDEYCYPCSKSRSLMLVGRGGEGRGARGEGRQGEEKGDTD